MVTPSAMLANPAPGACPRDLIAKGQDEAVRLETTAETSWEVVGFTMQAGAREASWKDQ